MLAEFFLKKSGEEGRRGVRPKILAGTVVPGGSVHGERANFTELVLPCIDAFESESRRIFLTFFRNILVGRELPSA